LVPEALMPDEVDVVLLTPVVFTEPVAPAPGLASFALVALADPVVVAPVLFMVPVLLVCDVASVLGAF
jgi:hypothetical protein